MIYHNDEDTHPLERAEQHVDVAFRFACCFLNQHVPVSGQDLLWLRSLAWQFYNRYSSVMQLYRHHVEPLTAEDEEKDNITPSTRIKKGQLKIAIGKAGFLC